MIISRSKAAKYAGRGECDVDGMWTIFGQLFRKLHGVPVEKLRRQVQLFEVLFAGERGQDAGGLYRECWTVLSQDLMSNSLPLLCPCHNSQ